MDYLSTDERTTPNLGFPYTYYPGEFLTESQARANRNTLFKKTVFLVLILQPLATLSGAEERSVSTSSEVLYKASPCSPWKTTPVVPKVSERLLAQNSKNQELDGILEELRDGSITTENAILKLRGGGLADWLIIIAVLYGLSHNTEGFQIPPGTPPAPHLDWLYKNQQRNEFRYGKNAGPRSITVVSQQSDPDSNEQLSPKELRNLPNPKDKIINLKDGSELKIRYGQAKFKLKKHGALYGLPCTENQNGTTNVLRSEENVQTFMDRIEALIKAPDQIWFNEGFYQKGTKREIKATHVYDPEQNLIVIFNKTTGEFITTCQPTASEKLHLLQSGNFGGEPIQSYGSAQGKNSFPEQSLESGFTPINTFETDVLGVTPIDPDWQI